MKPAARKRKIMEEKESRSMVYKRAYSLANILLVVALMLAACRPSQSEEPPGQGGDAQAETPVAEAPAEEPAVEAPEEEPSAGEETALDVYRIAILSDMTSSNIWNLWGPGASAYNYVVQANYWPALYTLGEHRYDFLPRLAADFSTPFEQEGDYWVTSVKLKEDFLWSDGQEITSEDLVFTANVVMDFELSGNWDYDGGDLDHFEAVDPDTIKFYYKMKPGLAVHEYGILQNPIVSKSFWEPKLDEAYKALKTIEALDPESEEYAAGLAEAQQELYAVEADGEPVSGAYMFDKWEVGAFVENVFNPENFYKGVVAEEYTSGTYREVKDDSFEFSAYGEVEGEPELAFEFGPNAGSVIYSIYNQDAAVLALLNGDVDYVFNPNGYGPGLRSQLDSSGEVTVVENPRNGFRFLAFNFKTTPMDEIAIRQAITCMIDKEFLTQNILQGAALPVYTPVPEGLAYWFKPDITRICMGLSEQERMEWAVERLREAGYSWDVEPSWNEARGGSVDWGEGLKMANGKEVPELTLLAPSPGYDPLRATSGVLIEQWAGMLGIPVRAKLTNFNNILNETLGGGGNWDMVVMGWSLTAFPDHMCDFFLEEYGGPFAFTGYAGEELTNLCTDFKASSDMEEARLIGYKMQEILATELPYTYLFANPVQDAYNLSAIRFPFTDTLDGIENLYGMPDLVNAPE
jgi:ABC-type transport system substrate-binding protein